MKRFLIIIASILLVILPAAARQPERGYRGFLDWSNDIGSVDMWFPGNKATEFYTGISTSHGYQFNPYLYIGGGLGYQHCSRFSSNIFSPFVHGRGDFRFGHLTPFGEIRLGYNLTNGGGIYFSPNIGYRFNWGRKLGINIGLGLSVLGYSADLFEIAQEPTDGYMTYIKVGTKHGCHTTFSFRIGIDF